ncbi:MAG: hypothetical protein IJ794_16645 [Lachnospiraceae bacterium]|nr:hypothetical protein [Lachnospiraceae bacterium]
MRYRKWLFFILIVECICLSGCANGTERFVSEEALLMYKESGRAGETSSEGQSASSTLGGENLSAQSGQDDSSQLQMDPNGEFALTVTSYQIESELRLQTETEDFPYAYIVYPEFELTKEAQVAYPQLANRLQADNDDIKEEAVEELANATSLAIDGAGNWLATSNQRTASTEVFRADDKMFGYRIIYDGYYNGAHPDMWFVSVAYDTQSGERLPLADVINDVEQMKKLPQIILENLVSAAQEEYQFTAEENAQMLPKIEEMVADNALVWTLDETGFHVYFDAYDLQFYAFGPIFCDLTLEEYPDLIVEKYRPEPVKEALVDRITYKNADTKVYTISDLEPYKEYFSEDGL